MEPTTGSPTAQPTMMPSIFPTSNPITSIPTTRRQWKKSFVATLLTDFDAVTSYVNTTNGTLNKWAQTVVEVLLQYDTAPKKGQGCVD